MNRELLPFNKRVLIAAYEAYGWGGASTAAYGLFRKMQDSGVDVHLVNIIDDVDEDYFHYFVGEQMGNPDGRSDVHNCVLSQAEFFTNPSRTRLPGLLAEISPDIAIGVDCIPALMLKKSRPDIQVIFLACGSEQAHIKIRSAKASDSISIMNSREPVTIPPVIYPAREVEAIQSCDLMLPNSDLTRDLYRYFYPTMAGKIGTQPIWFTEWICQDAAQFQDLALPFSEREFDILFIASCWDRKVKNYPLVERIISDCRDLKACVVGNIENEARYAKCTGFIASRAELFRIMGNSRSVVSTSLLDTAPGILFEATVMGCNVVASQNCGNWQLCHPALLVDLYGEKGFVQSIRLSVQKKYADNLDYFLKLNSYQDLLDTVAVL